MSSSVISTELVALDRDFGSDTSSVITELARLLHAAGRADSVAGVASPAIEREQKAGTGVPGGVAIPHCRSEAVSEPTLAFARLSHGVDFSGPDGAAHLVFLIAAPAGGGKAHLKILSKLARSLVREDFRETLRTAQSEQEVVDAVLGAVNASPKKKSAGATGSSPGNQGSASSAVSAAATRPAHKESREDQTGANAAGQSTTHTTRIVAVTACPTGIAHTYMAADALSQAAASRNDIELAVETQGSANNESLSPQVIEDADAVIFATDVGVRERERFAGKPVIESGVKRAINEPDTMLDEARRAAADPENHRKVAGSTTGSTPASSSTEKAAGASPDGGLSWGKKIQQAIMTGVSYMVPFVAAGGLLLALSFVFGGPEVANGYETILADHSLSNLPGHDILTADGPVHFRRAGLMLYVGAILFATGQAAMGFIVAALSGYIAFALAGRPGIAPGFVGGAISVAIGAGFIGGLATGLLAGCVALWIGNLRVPRWLGSLMPVVIIPLVTSLIVGLVMFLVLGQPLAAVMNGLQSWLASMSGTSAVVLGLILGLMMCVDLGGPINKAAYLFGTAGLSSGDQESMQIMAAIMAAGMVPPIALSIATFLRKKLFTPAEQENGKSAWILGLSFVSEGAIPFAAADPFRVIPAMMAGGAVTGALSMAFGVASRAPHGGIFVAAIPMAISPVWAYLLSIAGGVVVSTVAVIALKQFWPNKTVREEAEKAHAATAAR